MNWEQIGATLGINLLDSFLTLALTNPTLAKDILPSLLKVYGNLDTVLTALGYDTSVTPPVLATPPAPAPVPPANPAPAAA